VEKITFISILNSFYFQTGAQYCVCSFPYNQAKYFCYFALFAKKRSEKPLLHILLEKESRVNKWQYKGERRQQRL
jgi:hypothetical protein